jgi:hypothetical protein
MMSHPPCVPIMAHPPHRHSDLTFDLFLNMVAGTGKHIKLDFKELEAAQACLPILAAALPRLVGQHVWLNADILPGPGYDGSPLDAQKFLGMCIDFCPDCHLSLGWKVSVLDRHPYDSEHMETMSSMLTAHNLTGVVFAACARLVSYDPSPLAALLEKFPQSQLLLWTGTGEPPLQQARAEYLQGVFKENGLHERVGFDVVSLPGMAGHIAEAKVMFASTTKRLLGAWSPWQ